MPASGSESEAKTAAEGAGNKKIVDMRLQFTANISALEAKGRGWRAEDTHPGAYPAIPPVPPLAGELAAWRATVAARMRRHAAVRVAGLRARR